MPKFERMTIVRRQLDIRYGLADHEIFLSFYDDGGAYCFDEWWQLVGNEVFAKWCEDNKKDVF